MLSIAVIGKTRAPRKSEPSGFHHKQCGYYSSKYGKKSISEYDAYFEMEITGILSRKKLNTLAMPVYPE
ncbi:MAG: hypothetical protein O7D30_06835 [Rickettsia endosymbiont of Ixodes persulcatus]|nr:hypothetical protein [Rickettsia endosymbiont of Ixodes persulcatus]